MSMDLLEFDSHTILGRNLQNIYVYFCIFESITLQIFAFYIMWYVHIVQDTGIIKRAGSQGKYWAYDTILYSG